MKRALAVVSLLGLAALVMAARPGTEQQLFVQLNGQPVRWALPDGGRSGAFTIYDAGTANGTACMALTRGTTTCTTYVLPDAGSSNQCPVTPNVLMMVPETPVNYTMRPAQASLYWDGGVNVIDTDENFGVPLQPYVPWFVVPDSAATSLCFASDAGYVRVPVWMMQ
jgi:hypothetical protein